MTKPIPSADELRVLADAVCDGTVTEADALQLEQMLRGNAEAQRRYLASVRLDGYLRWEFGQQTQEAPPACPSIPMFVDVSVPDTVGYFSAGWPVAYMVATVLLGIGILIGSYMPVATRPQVAKQMAPAQQSPAEPRMEFVGRITAMVDCQWEGQRKDEGGRMKDELPTTGNGIHPSSFIPHPSSPVSLGDKFVLASGLMEITYDSGAKVILQGPCTYEVESTRGGYLSIGKLTARVEKRGEVSQKDGDRDQSQRALTLALSQGERGPGSSSSFPIPHSYFAVRTPTALVTDLGTEFGVEVSETGDTTSQVFRGSVKLQVASTDGKPETVARVLHENESAQVVRDGGSQPIVLDRPATVASFIREIPKQKAKLAIKTIDLVDVVAGGDGFSGRRNRGIDPTTGQVIGWAVSRLGHFPVGDGQYHRVEAMPFVDGVFVPDGRNGPVQIDSAGHTFGEFVNRSNEAGRYIWAGGASPSDDPLLLPKVGTRLGDVDYGESGHGYLSLCANNGITFDLDAIRHANPGCKQFRFCAMAGNAETDSRDNGSAEYADLRVFVDGQVRFQRREINGYSGAFGISIPIGENDRYLTLTSLDAGNGIAGDDIVFGDPRLETSESCIGQIAPKAN